MYTYQMVGLADQNNNKYESGYGTYSKNDGFKFEPWVEEDLTREQLTYNLTHEDCWRLQPRPVKRMTKEDIEKELGFPIEIVTGDDLKSRQDDFKNMLEEIFGGMLYEK